RRHFFLAQLAGESAAEAPLAVRLSGGMDDACQHKVFIAGRLTGQLDAQERPGLQRFGNEQVDAAAGDVTDAGRHAAGGRRLGELAVAPEVGQGATPDTPLGTGLVSLPGSAGEPTSDDGDDLL